MYNRAYNKFEKVLEEIIVMKKWNAPEIAALDMNETAGGLFPSPVEFWVLVGDQSCLQPCTPPEKPQPDPCHPDPQPETPDHVDQLS